MSWYLNKNEETIDKMEPLQITTLVPVKMRRVYSLLVGAFEGGSGYWMEDWGISKLPEGYAKSDIEFAHAEVPLLPGGALWIEAEVLDVPERLTLDIKACNRGLLLMATLYPRHWNDFITEGDDADTADVFLQLATMGDVVYG